jgi:hypothetical protein
MIHDSELMMWGNESPCDNRSASKIDVEFNEVCKAERNASAHFGIPTLDTLQRCEYIE